MKPMRLTFPLPAEMSDSLAPVRAIAPRRSHGRTLCRVAILAADTLGLLIPLAVLSSGAVGDTAPAAVPSLAMVGGITLGLNALQGLYPGDRLHPQETLRRRTRTLLLALILLPAVSMSAAPGDLWTVAVTTFALLAGLLLQMPLRRGIRGQLYRSGVWGTAAVFVGPRQMRETLAAFFATHWRYGLRPVQSGAQIAVLVRKPDTASAAMLRQDYPEVIVLADMPDLRVSGLHPADIGGRIGYPVGHAGAPGSATAKRIMDVAIALAALVLTAPVMLLAIIGIRIADAGPVFYIQRREGLGGRTFGVLKLRTMYQDADVRLATLLETDPQARAEWAHHFKLRRDPRLLPRIGSLLRACSIDELPQLINVLRGEMSIVGPRPFPDYHLAALPQAFRVKRASVAPGITGLWQISGRSDADLSQQQQLDAYYIDNRSLWFDLQIILGTVPALLLRKGAY